MRLPLPVRLWVRGIVPGEFAQDLEDDLEEGFGRRGRRSAWVWVLEELVRMPYVRLWRQALRMRRAGTRREIPMGGGGVGAWTTSLGLAVRGLLKRPSYAAVVILTLVVSIGSATVVFSVLEAVLLRSLPYEGSERIYRLYGTNDSWRIAEQEVLRHNWDRLDVSEDLARALKGAEGLEAVGAARSSVERLEDGGTPERVSGARILPGFFEVFHLEPVLGRLPSRQEVESGDAVVVLGETLWSSRYGRDPAIVGRTVSLDGSPHTVLGVLPAAHGQPSEETLWWAPARPDFAEGRTNVAVFRAYLRAEPATDAELRREVVEAVVARLAESDPAYEEMGARIVRLSDETAAEVGDGIKLLFLAVIMVVLIACVNLANLVVARGARRKGELAMRTALGASRSSLVWHLMAETLVVCAVGGGLGLLVATQLLDPFVALLTWGDGSLPRADTVQVNGAVLAFAAGATLFTAILAGLGPALNASRQAPWAALQRGPRVRGGRATRRTQGALLLVEAGLAVALLVMAGLLTRTAVHVANVDPGYEPESMVYVTVSIPESRYEEGEDLAALAQRLEERLARIPGTDEVSRTTSVPGLGGASGDLVWRADETASQGVLAWSADVSPGYFEALGIPLVAGRGFTSEDLQGESRVAVVSELFAERYLPADDPLGRTFHVGEGTRMEGGRVVAEGEESLTVVGIVGDVRQLAVVMEPDAMFYRPATSGGAARLHLMLKVSGDASSVLAAARAEIIREDPALIVEAADVLTRAMRRLLAALEIRMILIVSLAVLAAFLTMVGIYGVVAYVVSDQFPEIGLRMALGARAGGETARMVRQALGPVLLGALGGLGLAVPLTALLEDGLYGVGRLDPVTFAVALPLLAGVAAAAAWLPARRATSVDPMQVLSRE